MHFVETRIVSHDADIIKIRGKEKERERCIKLRSVTVLTLHRNESIRIFYGMRESRMYFATPGAYREIDLG